MDASVAVVYVLHANIVQVNFFWGGGVDGGRSKYFRSFQTNDMLQENKKSFQLPSFIY